MSTYKAQIEQYLSSVDRDFFKCMNEQWESNDEKCDYNSNNFSIYELLDQSFVEFKLNQLMVEFLEAQELHDLENIFLLSMKLRYYFMGYFAFKYNNKFLC